MEPSHVLAWVHPFPVATQTENDDAGEEGHMVDAANKNRVTT